MLNNLRTPSHVNTDHADAATQNIARKSELDINITSFCLFQNSRQIDGHIAILRYSHINTIPVFENVISTVKNLLPHVRKRNNAT